MADRTRSWFTHRTSRWPDCPPERVLELKQRRGSRSGGEPPDPALLRQFVRNRDGQVRQVCPPVPVHERPPVASVPVAAAGGPPDHGSSDRGSSDRGSSDRGSAEG